jgi:hypothetical protein
MHFLAPILFVFRSEINKAVAETRTNYEHMLYKEALKTGFFEFQVNSYSCDYEFLSLLFIL